MHAIDELHAYLFAARDGGVRDFSQPSDPKELKDFIVRLIEEFEVKVQQLKADAKKFKGSNETQD